MDLKGVFVFTKGTFILFLILAILTNIIPVWISPVNFSKGGFIGDYYVFGFPFYSASFSPIQGWYLIPLGFFGNLVAAYLFTLLIYQVYLKIRKQ